MNKSETPNSETSDFILERPEFLVLTVPTVTLGYGHVVCIIMTEFNFFTDSKLIEFSDQFSGPNLSLSDLAVWSKKSCLFQKLTEF